MLSLAAFLGISSWAHAHAPPNRTAAFGADFGDGFDDSRSSVTHGRIRELSSALTVWGHFLALRVVYEDGFVSTHGWWCEQDDLCPEPVQTLTLDLTTDEKIQSVGGCWGQDRLTGIQVTSDQGQSFQLQTVDARCEYHEFVEDFSTVSDAYPGLRYLFGRSADGVHQLGFGFGGASPPPTDVQAFWSGLVVADTGNVTMDLDFDDFHEVHSSEGKISWLEVHLSCAEASSNCSLGAVLVGYSGGGQRMHGPWSLWFVPQRRFAIPKHDFLSDVKLDDDVKCIQFVTLAGVRSDVYGSCDSGELRSLRLRTEDKKPRLKLRDREVVLHAFYGGGYSGGLWSLGAVFVGADAYRVEYAITMKVLALHGVAIYALVVALMWVKSR